MTERPANSDGFSSTDSRPLKENTVSPAWTGRNHSQLPPDTKAWMPR